jgi:hypothetical protein
MSRTVMHRSYVKGGGSTPLRGLSAAKQATSSALSGWGVGAPVRRWFGRPAGRCEPER